MSTKNKQHFLNILNFFKISFFPKRCIFCTDWFEAKGLMCSKCINVICKMDRRKKKCLICDSEIDTIDKNDTDTCSSCQMGRPSFSRNLSAMDYNDALGKLIHAVKFGQHRQGCYDLAEIMYRLIPDLDADNTVLSWIPLSSRRRLQRGFNQAEEIGKLIAEKRDILSLNVLSRILNTKPQARLNAEKRVENIKGAFVPLNNDKWVGKNIILIDDVITSGSTAQAAAETLLKYGSGRITLLTAGRG